MQIKSKQQAQSRADQVNAFQAELAHIEHEDIVSLHL